MLGWYVTAMGVNGAGAQIRYARVHTPGLMHMVPVESPTIDIRAAGTSIYFFSDNHEEIIETGFDPIWTHNPVTDTISGNMFTHLMVIPKFKLRA